MYESAKVALKIKQVAKGENISIGNLLEKCGLNKNTLSTMTSRGSWIQGDSIAKIADALDCSADYLLGRTDNPQSHKLASTVNVESVSDNHGLIGNNHAPVTINNSVVKDAQIAVLVETYNSLSPIGQARLLVYADELSKKEG